MAVNASSTQAIYTPLAGNLLVTVTKACEWQAELRRRVSQQQGPTSQATCRPMS